MAGISPPLSAGSIISRLRPTLAATRLAIALAPQARPAITFPTCLGHATRMGIAPAGSRFLPTALLVKTGRIFWETPHQLPCRILRRRSAGAVDLIFGSFVTSEFRRDLSITYTPIT